MSIFKLDFDMGTGIATFSPTLSVPYTGNPHLGELSTLDRQIVIKRIAVKCENSSSDDGISVVLNDATGGDTTIFHVLNGRNGVPSSNFSLFITDPIFLLRGESLTFSVVSTTVTSITGNISY